MIVCSCAVISDHDIELALVDIMSQPNAPIPTPGIVYRHLSKTMNCCGCVPLTVEVIYAKMEALEEKGLICPCACATARTKLQRFDRRTFQPKAARRPATRIAPPAAAKLQTSAD
jgi:hypothetical protein